MPIRLTRVRSGKWYAAGTVRVGERSEPVKEHSTGFAAGEKEAAEDYCRAETVRIQRELVHGKPAAGDRISWAQAIARYQGAESYVTLPRLVKFTHQFGEKFLDEITADDWGAFERVHLAHLKIPTLNDYRGLFRKVLTDAGHTLPPALAKALARRKPPKRPPAWLPPHEADALIACYAPHARPLALTARYQGMRTGELVRLEFRDLDFDHRDTDTGETVGSIFIRKTKNTEERTVPMHPAVRAVLLDLARKRQLGRVFVTPDGEAYADTTETGGNPFGSAHEGARRRCLSIRLPGPGDVAGPVGPHPGKTANRRAQTRTGPLAFPGVQGFRFHDWRHNYATQAIRDGMDLVSLKESGGWKTLEALEKYVHADFGHIARQLRKVR